MTIDDGRDAGQAEEAVKPGYKVNDEIDFVDDEGNMVHAKVLGVDPDGVLLSFIRKGDEYSTIRPFPAEYLDERLTGYNGQVIEKSVPKIEENAEKSGESVPETTENVPTEEPQQNIQHETLSGEEAERVLESILSEGTEEILPDAISTLSEFEQEFSSPVRTILGEVVKIGRNIYNKLVRSSRENISGALRSTLESADFVINDVDGSRLYVKMYKKQDGTRTYNVTVVNKTGEVEDYISSAHIKSDNNLLNKIRNGAELSLPSERISYEGTSSNNSTPISASEDTANAPIGQENAEVSAMSRIPMDEQGNPIYEQAETPELAWDAIVEQTEGDEAMAQTVADGMVADKRSALDKAEKAKSKGGNSVAEKIAAEKARKAAIEKARNELAIWELIAGTAARRAQESAEMAAIEEEVQSAEQSTGDVSATDAGGSVKSKRSQRRGEKQINTALRLLKEASEKGDALGMLDAIAMFDSNVAHGAEATEEESTIFEEYRKQLEREGYEMSLEVGMPYYEGMKVEADFVIDETLPPGESVISQIKKAQVLKDGKLIQAGKIIVRQSPYEPFDFRPPYQGENRAEYKEARDRAKEEWVEEIRSREAKEKGDNASHVSTDSQGNPIDENGRLITERINSIDELTDEDFTSPTRSVELPEIPKNVADAIGSNGKPVVIKKFIFEKNAGSHGFSPAQSREILQSALYNTDLVGQSQPRKRPNNWVVIKLSDESPITVLEVNEKKDNVEVVGWYRLDERNLGRIKRQAEREGGELLILSTKDRVESLSTPTQDLTSAAKVGNNSESASSEEDLMFRTFGGNSGYVGYSMSKRAAEAKREKVAELSGVLGVPVEIVESSEGLSERQQRAKGWFDKRTGKISVVLGNHTSVADVEKTVLHEAVAHYGLRKLFGEHFDKFIDNVWYKSSKEVREQIASLMAKHGWDYRVATEEYLAGLAEDANFENAVKTGWWEKLKQFFADMLRSLGIGYKGAELTDNELRYILWSSYENLKNGGKRNIFDEAADIVKREELGLIDNEELTIDNESKEEEIDAVNERFNEELAGLTEENADSVTFNLGRPSAILRAAGVEDMPMKLYGNKVIKKMKKHGFSLEELRDLPSAVANPIAVFNNYNKDGNRSVLTELKTSQGNFLVTIDLGKDADIDFNIISSVFGKGSDNIVDWINKDYATYINKEKAHAFLSHQSAPIAATAANAELVSAANIVENFENPSVEGENSDSSTSLRMTEGENDVLFREGYESPRERYDRETRTFTQENNVKWHENLPNRLKESYQDSMQALDILQRIVAEESGSGILSFENAYQAENAMSSTNKAESEMYQRDFYLPLIKEIQTLVADGAEYEDIKRYAMAKHGLERNVRMAQEKAEEEFEKYKERHPEGEYTLEDFIEKRRKEDYSGLTALFEKDFVEGHKPTERELERKARALINKFEKEHKTDALWEKINAATKETLKKSYESGMMSKETYEKVRDMYQFYVPLRGWNTDVAANEYEYLTSNRLMLSPALKKAGGRKSLADDPFATIGFMAESSIVQGNRNKMKQRFYFMASNHRSELLTTKTSLPPLSNFLEAKNGMPSGIPLNLFTSVDYLSDSRRQTPSSPRTRSSLCSSLSPLPKVLVIFAFAVLPSSAIVHSSIVQLLSPPAAPKKASAKPLS